MPISLRAAALRTALERALEEPVHLLATEHGVRLHAPSPAAPDPETWEAVLTALRSADRWGSSNQGAIPEIWAEVDEVST